MWNNASNCKRINIVIIFFLLVSLISFNENKVAFANDNQITDELNKNIDNILDEIDFSEINNECLNVPNLNLKFKDFVGLILNGEYNFSYNSILNDIKELIFKNIGSNLRFFISLFVVAILFEIFKSFSEDKSKMSKSSFKIIFSFLFATFILFFANDLYSRVGNLVGDLFNFSSVLFPILISLLTLSGSTSSASFFSTFSIFLLETGFSVLRYILLPISLSIFLLSIFGSVFSTGYFSKINSLFKTVFKYIFIIFFSVFGLLSTVNVIASASHDGINLKLAKFAIKNYIPVLGGYVSDGFDYVFSCSILIKNAVGVCSIIILVFKIIYPLIIVLLFSFGFKILSAVTGLIGSGEFSQMFDDVSGAINNFLSVILASFLIVFIFVFLIIMAVGVV